MKNDKPYIEQLCVIVKTSDGTVRQVALTREKSELLTKMLPSLFDGGPVKILKKELSLTLEPYKK